MDSSIFRYILRHTLRDQILILLLTVVSFPFLYYTLEVPKLIINDAIGGANVPDELFGYEMTQVRYLFLLSGLFLLLVLINGGLKYVLNFYRGVIGERMLRRFRYELFTRLLRFPVPHFKRVSQGEIIPIITAETEPLGGFIGDAFALPAFQGGILFTYLFFIFNQDPVLGAVATALYPFQLYIIPKLQRVVNRLGKERVLAARRLGDRVGDTIAGIREIHAHDTSRYEKAVISKRLGDIYEIRLQIYLKKFFIKFLNNFLAQVTPFFFYAVGGYYVIQGELSLGALVAVLAAFKDLSAPWKELLKYYQTKEDVRIKYEQILEQFHTENMLEEKLQDTPPVTLAMAGQGWKARNLVYAEHEGIHLLEQLNFEVGLEQHTAVVGHGGSGKEELGYLLARLVTPTSGRLTLAGSDLAQLPESVLGRHLAHVGANAHIFTGTLHDNLLYSLRHRLLLDPERAADPAHQRWRLAAELAGNSSDDPEGQWLDLSDLGLEDTAALRERIRLVLRLVDMDQDVFRLGLLGQPAASAVEAMEARVLAAREEVHKRLDTPAYTGLVEPFLWEQYNSNLTVLENILFSSTNGRGDKLESLAADNQFQAFLQAQGLLQDFLQIGRRLTEIMVDLFKDVDESSDLFERFSFIRAEDLPDYRVLLKQTAGSGAEHYSSAVKEKFLSMTFKLCPARHRLGLIEPALQLRILQARFRFAEQFSCNALQLEVFDLERYNHSLSLQDNILFGKLVYGQAKAQSMISELIHEVIKAKGLEEDVLEVGLAYEVGAAGTRLSLAQRQKLALARGLLKGADALILNEATSGLDPAAEARVLASIREYQHGRGLVLITNRAELAAGFDQVLVLDRGRLAEQGSFDELRGREGLLRSMLGAT